MRAFRSLAAAQTTPRRAGIAANLAEHEALALRAAREGVQVVVFPELSLTGYELDLARELSFSENDDRLAPLIALSSAHALTLIVGAPLRVGAALYIAAFILAPDGSVGLYTKRYLGAFPGDETRAARCPRQKARFFKPVTETRSCFSTATAPPFQCVRTWATPRIRGRPRSAARSTTWRACSAFPPISSKTEPG